MTRTSNLIFLYQAFVSLWMLVFGSIGLVTAWALLSLQESGDSKRPGIDLKRL
jgi:hypothetical protein